MRIIIVGAGVIGSNLAKELSQDHEVYLIESDPQTANKVAEKLDVKVVVGNGSSPDNLTQVPIHNADLVIAVTTSDENNIVICSLAAAYGAKHKVARVRNPSLERALQRYRGERFDIDDVINPEELAAETILKGLQTPGAREVADFAEGRILFRVFDVEENSPLCGITLDALNTEDFPWPFLIIAVMREGEVFFPKGNTQLNVGDRIYVLLPKTSAGEFMTFVDPTVKKIKKVIIGGATIIGEMVAAKLSEQGVDVSLVEEDRMLAEEAADRLSKVRVINGSASEADILKECGIEAADAFVAASASDQFNLVAAVMAKKMGARKTMITTKAPDYMGIMDVVDIDTIINPRFLAVDQILRYVRGTGISAVSSFAECDAEAIELIPEKDSPITKTHLKEISFPKDSLVGAVCRGDEVLLATGDLTIQEGEKVIIFCREAAVKKVQKLFTKKKVF